MSSSSATPSSSTRNGGNRKRTAADQAKAGGAADHQRDVRSKLSDFHRFVDDIVAETEDTKQEILFTKRQLTEASEQARIAREQKDEAVQELRRRVIEYESAIDELNEEKLSLQRRIDTAASDAAELGNLRSIVQTIKSQLKDYITLEISGVSLLTTTGQVVVVAWGYDFSRKADPVLIYSDGNGAQVTNFEGIVKQWLNTPMFNGETNFSFTCPMTRRPASLVKDQGGAVVADLISHHGDHPSTPPLTSPRRHHHFHPTHRGGARPRHHPVIPLPLQPLRRRGRG
jgi:hypothetical protein